MKKLSVIVMLALACNASYATLVSGDSGGAVNSVGLNRVQPAASAPPSMLHGVITALNLDKGDVVIHGNHLHVSPTVRVFGPGGEVNGLTLLRKGKTIRFLLDPKDATERTISIIYLQ